MSAQSQRIVAPLAVPTKTESYRIIGGLKVIDRFFTVPLSYHNPSGEKIQIFARSAIPNKENDDGAAGEKLPICVYLEGGPGFECSSPKNYPLTEWFFKKGYQMLYLDQRGTGLSTPIDAEILTGGRSVEEQGRRLKEFRADNIVRDCEAVRQALLGGKEEEEERKWTVIGQSFGGFCAVTYLSFYPEGLKEVFATGGMPPLISSPDPVYERTWRKVLERNRVYYKKYPQDVEAVQRIVGYLTANPLPLPSGGVLTPDRFLDLGIAFGGHGGIDSVHLIVQRFLNELDLYNTVTHKLKAAIESTQSFDRNPIYAVLHEAVYCQSSASNWSASRLRPPPGPSPLWTGEMILPHHFSSYSPLSLLAPVAMALAEDADWPALYDVEQLGRNDVPVYAANYIDDMYVAYDLASVTVKAIKGARSFDTNLFMHNAVSLKTDKVMDALWELKVGEID